MPPPDPDLDTARSARAPDPHPPSWPRVIDQAQRHGGAIRADQLRRAGLARSTADDRIRREGWVRPYRGVVLLPGANADDGETLARAAVLSVGEPAALTDRSALAFHGIIDDWPATITLLLPASVRRIPPAGVKIRRSRHLRPSDVVRRRDLPVASIPRGFLDAAATTGQDELRTWLIDMRQRRQGRTERVLERVEQAPPGVPGRGRLLAACNEVAASGADSVLVHRAEGLVRSAGIAIDVPPRRVRTPARLLQPDITIVDRPVAIEADGFGFHAARRDLELDHRKHNAYLLAGWTVLRVGWDRLQRDPAGFLAELRAAITAVEG